MEAEIIQNKRKPEAALKGGDDLLGACCRRERTAERKKADSITAVRARRYLVLQERPPSPPEPQCYDFYLCPSLINTLLPQLLNRLVSFQLCLKHRPVCFIAIKD
ncbi:hypothetical protein MHYP_G00144040 [Metynnis hypsauchen]